MNSICYFYNFLNIFAITPCYDFDRGKLSKTKFTKFCALTIAASSLYCIYDYFKKFENSSYLYDGFSAKSLIFIISYLILNGTVLLASIKSGFFDGKKWIQFFTNMNYNTTVISENKSQKNAFSWNFYSTLLLLHFFCLLVLSCQVYVWSNFLNMPLLEAIIFGGWIQMYYEFLMVLLIKSLIDCFKVRYKILNETLLKISNDTRVIINLKKLVQKYRLLFGTVNIFNSIFGYQILLLLFRFAVELIIDFSPVFLDFRVEGEMYWQICSVHVISLLWIIASCYLLYFLFFIIFCCSCFYHGLFFQ